MNTQPIPLDTHSDNKVPEVTLAFWLIKVMSTTVGETGADYLAVNADWGQALTTGTTLLLTIIAFFFQFHSRRCVPWIYWLTVLLVSVVGTQITDALTDSLDVSLYVSTLVFAVLLITLFSTWYYIERTLSIRTIKTYRREIFYWSTVLCTFALGTAAGDLITEEFEMGFTLGIVLFGALISTVFIAWYVCGMNTILAFWIAYILTRPMGASFGDFLTQSSTYGGVGLGAMLTTAIFLSVIIVLVIVAHVSNMPRKLST